MGRGSGPTTALPVPAAPLLMGTKLLTLPVSLRHLPHEGAETSSPQPGMLYPPGTAVLLWAQDFNHCKETSA